MFYRTSTKVHGTKIYDNYHRVIYIKIMKAVCRLCLKLPVGSEYELIDDTNVITNRQKIVSFLPQVIDSVDNFVLCLVCSKILQEMQELKLFSERTEENIKKYFEENNCNERVNLLNVVESINGNVDANPIEFVPCEEEKYTIINPGRKNITILLPDEENLLHLDRFTTNTDILSNVDVKEEMSDNIDDGNLSDAINSTSKSDDNDRLPSFKENKVTLSKRFKCVKCDATFYSINNLQKHQMLHKTDCDICGKVFKKKFRAKIHMADVHGCTDKAGKHKCDHCNDRFITENALLKHLMVHSVKKGYSCNVCGKQVSTPKHLKNHMRCHSEGGRFECEYCQMKFSQKNVLVTHLRCHTGEKPYKCERCGKGFAQSGTMYTHIRDVHIGEKRYTCHLCSTKFKYESSLRLHIAKHSGEVEKTHVCEVCGKSFFRAFGLTKHMLWHTNVKNHLCVICGKSFVEAAGLKRHFITHTGEKPHQCHLCEFRCNQKSNLTIHLKSHKKKLVKE